MLCSMIIHCSYYPHLLLGPHVMWVPCHHGMAHPQLADEDGLQLRRVAANKLNKQLQTADKECASSLEVGCESNNLSP
jgi:hypothetical protein